MEKIFFQKIYEVSPWIHLISLSWFKWSPASGQCNDTMATRVPPAGPQDLGQEERDLLRVLSRYRVLNRGVYNPDVCFIITKTRKFGPALNYFYRPKSPGFSVCMTGYTSLTFSEHLLGNLIIALLCWNLAGLGKTTTIFSWSKNESQSLTGIDHSLPACKSWNQVIFTSFLLTE